MPLLKSNTFRSIQFSVSNFVSSTDIRNIPVLLSPPVNIIAPVIEEVGASSPYSSYTVSNNGTWLNSPASYTFQWKADDIPISLATNSSYDSTDNDIGKVLLCSVTAINSAGSAQENSNSFIRSSLPVNTILPIIVSNGSNPANVGDTLSISSNGTWLAYPSITSYSYLWVKNSVSIGVADSSYVVQAGDEGSSILCQVTATNTYGGITIDSNTINIL